MGMVGIGEARDQYIRTGLRSWIMIKIKLIIRDIKKSKINPGGIPFSRIWKPTLARTPAKAQSNYNISLSNINTRTRTASILKGMTTVIQSPNKRT